MKLLQYRFHDTPGEAPTRWYNNGSGNPETDKAIRQIIEGRPFDAVSVIIRYEDDSAIEYRLEPRESRKSP